MDVDIDTTEFIKEVIIDFPQTKIFYEDIVCKRMECSLDELVCISTINDKEGWELEDFFEEVKSASITQLYENYSVPGYIIGEVLEIKHKGKIYIAERNNSPWFVYGKAEK